MSAANVDAPFADDEVEEARTNLIAFFTILAEWHAAQADKPDAQASAPSAEDDR